MMRLFVMSTALMICATTTCVKAQPGQTAQGAGQATIAEPLSVVALNDLDFGSIAASPTLDGAAVIDTATGSAEYSGGARAACTGSSGCAVSPAIFMILGENGRSYTIGLPRTVLATPIIVSAPDLQVDRLTAISVNSGTDTPALRVTGILDADGRDHLKVGGRLLIPGGTQPGRYSAKIPVMVTYS